ncbi:hypothetical protein BS47DRAFT_1394161 [Hydnum rufescens UP504]|uniref:Uncharacterized protein n=1 Tax=Hydnum rufescens UP504 TaxID=1448309 RepID=A0A9P6DSW2_9AGAM|nr:hypothetical protein BS47DRAFT_1394161 [Hydnum rufescens UP504]
MAATLTNLLGPSSVTLFHVVPLPSHRTSPPEGKDHKDLTPQVNAMTNLPEWNNLNSDLSVEDDEELHLNDMEITAKAHIVAQIEKAQNEDPLWAQVTVDLGLALAGNSDAHEDGPSHARIQGQHARERRIDLELPAIAYPVSHSRSPSHHLPPSYFCSPHHFHSPSCGSPSHSSPSHHSLLAVPLLAVPLTIPLLAIPLADPLLTIPLADPLLTDVQQAVPPPQDHMPVDPPFQAALPITLPLLPCDKQGGTNEVGFEPSGEMVEGLNPLVVVGNLYCIEFFSVTANVDIKAIFQLLMHDGLLGQRWDLILERFVSGHYLLWEFEQAVSVPVSQHEAIFSFRYVLDPNYIKMSFSYQTSLSDLATLLEHVPPHREIGNLWELHPFPPPPYSITFAITSWTFIAILQFTKWLLEALDEVDHAVW